MGRNREQDLESKFQAELIKDLESMFPGCFVLKNDAALRTGIPDLTVLWNNRWAMLEVKAYAKAVHQPNQDFYIEHADDMSFGAFIFPENKDDVLDDLAEAFGIGG